MSHRNNDNNVPWNNRNQRNNNNDGMGGGNYKNWGGGNNNRYGGPDNRYNNSNKDRRNYRGGYGGNRRSYEDRRPYRNNNSWNNNNGAPDGNYPRNYQNNWHQKQPDQNNKGGNKYGPQIQQPEPDIMAQQIPPMMIDFADSDPVEEQAPERSVEASGSNDGAKSKSTNGTTQDKEAGPERTGPESNSNKSWLNDEFGSPGEGFQGFAEDDFEKTPNGSAKFDGKVPTREEKGNVSLQENELRTLIVDEAMKIISDAEQPSCSSNTSQKSSSETITAATTSASASSNPPNPERRASIERSAEQVTRKLINQLTSMNKHSLKQVINNPDSKYETALKTHARQKLRAEVRRQLRNFNLNEGSAQTKTSCGMLEPDECVDSDKIPEALLEQIGKVLDLNLLDLNVTEESAPSATTAAGEEDDCVINPGEADFSATEVLDKNLRLTDEDEQFDTDDLFARAELLLMKGSESVRQGNSSGPSSPTDEMFPNEQIDSIVSEDNGVDMQDPDADPDQEQIERMLDERLAPSFPCFLRVSTVEELNKKVDDLPVPKTEEEEEQTDDTVPIVLSSIQVDSQTNDEITPEVNATPPVADKLPEPENPPVEAIAIDLDQTRAVVESPTLPAKEETAEETSEPVVPAISAVPVTVEVAAETVTPPVEDKPAEKPQEQDIAPTVASPQKVTTPEQPSPAIIRAPTHPELAARKPKGSKTYKPNLVQHEHPKRDGAKPSTGSPSRPPSSSSSSSTSKALAKSGSSLNLAPSKPSKPQNPLDKNDSTSSRGRSRSRRDTASGQNPKDPKEAPPNNATSESLPSATPSVQPPSAGSSPASHHPQPSEQPPQRSARAKTPGPALAGGPQDHSSSLGVKKKKKKKRNKRKDRSPPPDLGMMLECDLRVSRPAVTPTPPPVHSREPSSLKKNPEPERSSSSSKPSRETRAKSADPKLYYESKRDRDRKDKDRDRDRDKQRIRDDEGKKSRSKEEKKETDRDRDKVDNRDRESRKEKEAEREDGNGSDVGKPDRNERKKSPAPKASATAKHSNKEEPKEIPKEVAVEKEKESSKDDKEIKVKDFAREKESVSKDKEEKDVPDGREAKGSDDTQAVKEISETPAEQTKPAKPEKKKKKKSLLKGPNLIKGRREVVEVAEAVVEEQAKQIEEVVVVIEDTPPPSVSQPPSEPEAPPQTRNKQKDTAVSSKQSLPVAPATTPVEHSSAMTTSATLLMQRTASPRPWKSPGEKKIIPPAICSMITHHPMSPPTPERPRKTPTPTPPSPVRSPEPSHHPQRIHLAASPVVLPQADLLARLPIQSSIAPLVATTITPPENSFAPVMALLNQMQEIDNKMSDFQRRKMQIDSEMMRLNSEKFQIDQNSMQLQNERFMLLNTLRAVLVECELKTLASMQSVSHMPAAAMSPALANRRRNPETEPESAPRTKRRKETQQEHEMSATDQSYRQVPISSSATELSEPEEPTTPSSSVATGGERTIRRITKISGNTEILKLFQRRRLISDRSTEESQPEDNGAPQVAASVPTPTTTTTTTVEKPTAAKRRRTRTYGGGGTIDQSQEPSTAIRLRSDSTRSVESGKSIEIVDHPPVVPAATATRLKKDEEIPLAKHRVLLPREVKVVINRLNVAKKRGASETT